MALIAHTKQLAQDSSTAPYRRKGHGISARLDTLFFNSQSLFVVLWHFASIARTCHEGSKMLCSLHSPKFRSAMRICSTKGARSTACIDSKSTQFLNSNIPRHCTRTDLVGVLPEPDAKMRLISSSGSILHDLVGRGKFPYVSVSTHCNGECELHLQVLHLLPIDIPLAVFVRRKCPVETHVVPSSAQSFTHWSCHRWK